MKIAITASEPSLEGAVDPRFGRCENFLIVETDDMGFEGIENPNVSLGGGAGIQSARLLAAKEVKNVLTGNCGPNAFEALTAAGIGVITGCSGSVRGAIEDFQAGKFQPDEQPSVTSKFGMGPGGGRGMGRGQGQG